MASLLLSDHSNEPVFLPLVKRPLAPLRALALLSLAVLLSHNAQALEYPYVPYNQGKLEPRLTGWPLTPEELDFIGKASHTRRPGSESGATKISFLPYTPSAEGSGNPNWYVGVQEKFIKVVDQYNRDNGIDVDCGVRSVFKHWRFQLAGTCIASKVTLQALAVPAVSMPWWEVSWQAQFPKARQETNLVARSEGYGKL